MDGYGYMGTQKKKKKVFGQHPKKFSKNIK
jgi:hypothetical protein